MALDKEISAMTLLSKLTKSILTLCPTLSRERSDDLVVPSRVQGHIKFIHPAVCLKVGVIGRRRSPGLNRVADK